MKTLQRAFAAEKSTCCHMYNRTSLMVCEETRFIHEPIEVHFAIGNHSCSSAGASNGSNALFDQMF